MERATRLCAMSPQIATFSPSIRPKRWRMAAASSSAWVGCSLVPSPALMHRASMTRRDRRRRAVLAVADDQRIGPHRVQRPRGVLQRLALLHRDCSTGRVIADRAEPVRGGREGHQGARRIFVEQVEDDLAARARRLAARSRLWPNQCWPRSRMVAICASLSESMDRRSTSASLIAEPADWPARRSRPAGCARRPARRPSRRGGRG